MSIEAMKQALEALEWNLPVIEDYGDKEQLNRQHRAITSLRQAIEQTEKQEPVAWNSGVPPLYPEIKDGETISVEYLETTPQPQRERVIFPTMLRKMWSGGEVQAWLDENVNKEKNA